MNRLLDLDALNRSFTTIARKRGWSTLHTPQNLATALTVEAAELLRLFQWSGTEDGQSAPEREAVAAELADILLYSNALADALDIDLNQALADKCRRNEQRFGAQDG